MREWKKLACSVFHVVSRVEECLEARFHSRVDAVLTLVAEYFAHLLSFIAAY